MKIKSTFIIALLGLVLTTGVRAQDHPNVVKINLFGLAARNFSLQYERALTKKSAVALGFGFLPSGAIPLVPQSAFDSDSSGTLKSITLSGFSITPEYRWYPGTKDGAPNGFYLAPYIRYSKYSIATTVNFDDPSTNTKMI